MSRAFIYTRLYLPRPLAATRVEELLTRLTAPDVPRPMALEVRADDDGVQYLLGCTPTSIHSFKRLIGSYLDGASFGPASRRPLASAARITARPAGVPLGLPDPETTTQALLAALGTRTTGETVALQAVLGRARSPERVDAGVADPLQSLGHSLVHGIRPAPAETRKRIVDHASDPRVQVALRIGVESPDPKHRHALAHRIFGALHGLEAAGVRLRLEREAPVRLEHAELGHTFHLTPRNLLSVLAWPLGERDYPGIDPVHPTRLPVPKSVTATESVFAVGTAPGPERLVGLAAPARLSHLSVMAPTGAGKSEAVLAPLLLSDVAAGRPVVLVDPKGQLVEYVTDCLDPAMSERLVIFDPSDVDGTARFNPLDARERDPYAVADSIMAVFKAVFSEGWGPRTEDILHASLLTLAIDGQRRDEPHTLLDLPRLLTEPSFRRDVVQSVSGEPEVARFWARYESLSPGQQEHEIAAPMNKLRRYLMRRGVRAVLGEANPPFRLRDIWQGDRIVLVALNDALGGAETSQLVGGLICAEVFMAAQERAVEKDPKKRPGFVYVDEIRKFLHLPIPLGAALEICRSYGVGWALFGQGYYQLGTDLAQAVEVNTKSKLAFATTQGEARLIAKQAPELTAEDIQGLPKFEIYANLLTDQGSSGWFSARTLPPPARQGHGDALRQACRERNRAVSPPGQQVLTADEHPSVMTSTHAKRRRS